MRFTSAEWCEAALTGPGGELYSLVTTIGDTDFSRKELALGGGVSRRVNNRPLGVWCAMAEKGKFIV